MVNEIGGSDLRRNAEDLAQAEAVQTREDLAGLSPEAMQEIIFELRVHQIELELQNEELLRAQVELGKSNARFFDLYELAPVGYCTLGERGLVLEANLALAALLGMGKISLMNKPLSRFVHKDDQDAYFLHFRQQGDASPRESADLRLVRPDGTSQWVTVGSTVAQDGAGGPVMLVVVTDIDQRKREEAIRLDSEEHYRLLFDSSPMAVSLQEIIWDPQGRPFDCRFLEVNQGMESQWGVDRSRLLQHTLREVFPDLETIQIERYCHVAVTRKADHFEQYFPAVDRHLEVHAYSTSPDQFLVLALDISERKKAEGIQSKLQDELRRAASALRKAQEDERIRISREIHDELGQLITASKIEVCWLERKLEEPGLPEALNPLVDRVVHLGELTDKVLSTVQRIAKDLRPNLTDQLGLEGALRHEVQQVHARSLLSCSVVGKGTFPVVPPRLKNEIFFICREALTNVLRHAQAMHAEVGWFLEDGIVGFTVTDDGIGLGSLDFGMTSGIGLTSMRERAALCGGTLRLEPNLPHGTKVTVCIPIAKLTDSERLES